MNNSTVPNWYKCGQCGRHGVQLWRVYCSFSIELHCQVCAEADQVKARNGDEIGWLVPAVPDTLAEDGRPLYWGYSSVPQAGVLWWKSLPRLEEDGPCVR